MKQPKIITTLFNKPYLFRRLTTLNIEEFNLLAAKLEPEWKQREYERLLARPNRKNKPGQGRKYELGSFANLLLVIIIYLRTTIGSELLSLLFDIDQSTIKRIVRRVMPLLTDRFIPKTELTKKKRRTNNLDEFLKDYPELKDVIFDGTDVNIKRPQKRQKQSYSGKRKRHTKKTIIALHKQTKLITGVSPPKKGTVHDKKQLEATGWNDKLSTEVNRHGDLGFYGMSEDNWIIPNKKPKGKDLTEKQRRQNRNRARDRMPVEHSIRGVKMFRRIGELVTIKSDDFLYNVLLASANLYNFKRLVRQGIY